MCSIFSTFLIKYSWILSNLSISVFIGDHTTQQYTTFLQIYTLNIFTNSFPSLVAKILIITPLIPDSRITSFKSGIQITTFDIWLLPDLLHSLRYQFFLPTGPFVRCNSYSVGLPIPYFSKISLLNYIIFFSAKLYTIHIINFLFVFWSYYLTYFGVICRTSYNSFFLRLCLCQMSILKQSWTQYSSLQYHWENILFLNHGSICSLFLSPVTNLLVNFRFLTIYFADVSFRFFLYIAC